MPEDLIGPLFILLIVVIAGGSLLWTASRADTLLTRWAAANAYTLVQTEQRWLRTGPYFWRHSRGQLIYYVTVRDERGQARSGYVRLGSWLGGLLSDQVDVTWDG